MPENQTFRSSLKYEGHSAFRQEVLNAAAKIPWGIVLTYGELAKAIGQPQASRAVGQPWREILF